MGAFSITQNGDSFLSVEVVTLEDQKKCLNRSSDVEYSTQGQFPRFNQRGYTVIVIY